MDADHVTIDRNHVYSTSWYSVYASSGISVLAARDIDGGDGGKTYKIRITSNRVHDNETKVRWERCKCYSDGNGIIVDTLKDKAKGNEEGPDYQGRVLVAGNVSYDNGGSGIRSYKSQHVASSTTRPSRTAVVTVWMATATSTPSTAGTSAS